MAALSGFKAWFKEKVVPYLKMLPKAALFGLVVGWLFLFYVLASFKFYIYITGAIIGLFGYYVVVLLARRIKSREYPSEEYSAEGGEEVDEEEELETEEAVA